MNSSGRPSASGSSDVRRYQALAEASSPPNSGRGTEQPFLDIGEGPAFIAGAGARRPGPLPGRTASGRPPCR